MIFALAAVTEVLLGVLVAVLAVLVLVLVRGRAVERRRAAFRLVESQRELRAAETRAWRAEAIVAGMPEGVFVVDRERRLVTANAPARELLAAERAAAGMALFEAMRIPEVERVIERALATGGVADAEVVLATREQERALRLVGAPFGGTGEKRGDWEGCVVTVHDVTELRRLEKVRRDFVANVSHELKTPLTTMRSYLEALADDPAMDPATRRSFLAKALAGTERLSAIVVDLLSLARLEAGDGSLRFERVDAAEAVRGVVREWSPSAAARRIRVDVRADERAWIRADREGLHAAIANLVDNAIKYSPEGCDVAVRCSVSDTHVTIEVEDHGPGIPRSERQRIFERFYRVDRDRSRRLGGTGLGLSIVRNVVKVHGGEVELDSEVGRGSTFRIRLPRATAECSKEDTSG